MDRHDAYGAMPGTVNNFYKTPLAAAVQQSQQSQAPALQYSRYDQERFAAGREDTAGFRIDTMSSYHGKALASMVGSTTGGVSEAPKVNDGIFPVPAPMYDSSGAVAMLPPATPGRETPGGARTPRDPRALGLSTPNAGSLTPDPC